MGWAVPNLEGKTVGDWTVICRAGVDPRNRPTWLCRCVCGVERNVLAGNLVQKVSRGCGCAKRAAASERARARNLKHGAATRGAMTPEYRAWRSMLNRCAYDLPPNKYHHGLGVTVCDRWQVFDNFLADMGVKPSAKHSLDRFPDPAGNYEPGNCRWATAREQRVNRRV